MNCTVSGKMLIGFVQFSGGVRRIWHRNVVLAARPPTPRTQKQTVRVGGLDICLNVPKGVDELLGNYVKVRGVV